MAHHNTVFRQLLDLLPRHEFDTEARQHQNGQRLRVMSRWAQFVALGLGQLAGLQSLRDIVGNLCAQPHKLYHLGMRTLVSRSSLARVNAEQPYTLYETLFGRLHTLYETLFGRLLARCQQRAPRHGFRFKNRLYAVDASTIDLCLAAFPWASFRRTKGAIKLHVGLDAVQSMPARAMLKISSTTTGLHGTGGRRHHRAPDTGHWTSTSLPPVYDRGRGRASRRRGEAMPLPRQRSVVGR